MNLFCFIQGQISIDYNSFDVDQLINYDQITGDLATLIESGSSHGFFYYTFQDRVELTVKEAEKFLFEQSCESKKVCIIASQNGHFFSIIIEHDSESSETFLIFKSLNNPKKLNDGDLDLNFYLQQFFKFTECFHVLNAKAEIKEA